MAKILVTYFSLTGNTRTIAQAIYEALPPPKEIQSLEKVKDTDSYDLLFIGFPVHTHSVPYPVENFLKSLPPGKKVALFSTHGSHTGSRLSREALEHALSLLPETHILGTFTCRGKVSPQAMELFQKLPEHQGWAVMAPSAYDHPDKNDIDDAQAFARWVLALYHS
jgi:flavodoxin